MHRLVFTDFGSVCLSRGLGRRIDVWHGNTPALYLSQKESNLTVVRLLRTLFHTSLLTVQ